MAERTGNPQTRQEKLSMLEEEEIAGKGRSKVYVMRYDLRGLGKKKDLIVGAMESNLKSFKPWHNLIYN